ncbi:hypothetical protein [Anthocerotibacter panamensis]|uniref:hypothetical protein n=1 Tax=Anthocerotibacter panamensis TaxID=2857077 RepID=UPI001C401A62|nr:hypothetical protein [Anthocerotibacter panamensis]
MPKLIRLILVFFLPSLGGCTLTTLPNGILAGATVVNFNGSNQEQIFNNIVNTAFRETGISEIECPADAHVSKDFYGRCGNFQGDFSEFKTRFDQAVNESIQPKNDWWRHTKIWEREYSVKTFLEQGKQNQWMAVDFEPYNQNRGLVTMSMSRRAVSEKQSLEPTAAFLKRYGKEFRMLGEPLMVKSGAKFIVCPKQIHEDYTTPRGILICGSYPGSFEQFRQAFEKAMVGKLGARDDWEQYSASGHYTSFDIYAYPTGSFFVHFNPLTSTGTLPDVGGAVILFDIRKGLGEPD